MFVRILIANATFAVMILAAAQPALSAEPPAAGDGKNNKPDEGPVVATINGTPVYKAEVDRGVIMATGGQKIDAEALPTVQATVLKQMIDNYLLQSFLAAQKNLVSRAEINAAINEIRSNLRNQNVSFEAFLASQRTTEQAFINQLAVQLTMAKYAANNTTEEGLKKFFDEKRELFDGTVRRVSHVLLRPDGPADDAVFKALREQAQTIHGQLQSGQLKFDEAVTRYSAGPSRQRGGDLGYVPLTGVMAPAFTRAAYGLKPDEISEPVTTTFGIHLIKVTEIKAGSKKFEDVKPFVQKAYGQYLIEKLMEDQEKAAKIEYAGNYPYFKPGTKEVVMPGTK